MVVRPASTGRPRFDIADIVRRHRGELEAGGPLSRAQHRVLTDIEQCRTATLGGHVEHCRSCGYEQPSYNSCRNRHCPKCQALAQQRWIAARAERLLPVRHFHVVFTLPAELRPLARAKARLVFDALFAAASQTLLELGATHLDARLGVTMVLHTWRRDLGFHPHVHALVTAGGLSRDGSHWQDSGSHYLFPVQVLGALLRGKMMAALRELHQEGRFEGFEGFVDPQGFDRLMAQLARRDWVVYAKKPFREVHHVISYLGRYTHRVAIANSRLVAISETAVTFRTKSGQTVTLTPCEFLRRFLQHVLPARLHKIRHYGLYAGAAVRPGGALEQARAQLVRAPEAAVVSSELAALATLLESLCAERAARPCPQCGAPLQRRRLRPASSRAPPWMAVA